MKVFSLILFFFFIARPGKAQDLQLAWQVDAVQKTTGVYSLRFSTTVPAGYHLYTPGQSWDGFVPFALELDSSIVIEDWSLPASKKIKDLLFEGREVSIAEGTIHWSVTIRFTGTVPATISGNLSYCYANNEELYPLTNSFSVPLPGGQKNKGRLLIPTIDLAHPLEDCGNSGNEDEGLLTIFLLGLGGGLIALLTPCVFPMIPLTVSFFSTGGGGKKKSLLYGLSIVAIYFILSTPFYFFESLNPEVLNNLSTNAWLNLAFFLIFIFFAFSFFGFYEITLPSSMVNKVQGRGGGGTGGILFLALTLALVSFSCTGPILGSLLAGALGDRSGAVALSTGMTGFGVGLGLPFTLFALFPAGLKKLPRSGAWMGKLKIMLGFVELALALKFLSNADLVKQWGLLPREVFIGIWLLTAFGLFSYLAGFLKFPHDTHFKKLGPARLAGIVILPFGMGYLSAGLTNTQAARLEWISGFPPPPCYSIYPAPVNCIRAIQPVHDFEEGLQKARMEGKLLLLDFTGWACVNCRRMEERVWTDPEVKNILTRNFVVISLYVDEQKRLPLAEQSVLRTASGERQIRTLGDRWASFQSENFRSVSQPQYVILNTEEILLNHPIGYTPDPREFESWLRCGLNARGGRP